MSNHQATIAELKARIEQMRRDRVAAGKPADPPKPFFPLPLAIVTAERMPDYFAFIVKYAQIIDETNVIPTGIDCAKFERHYGDFDLLAYTDCADSSKTSIWARSIYGALREIAKFNEGQEELSPDLALQSLYKCIRLARIGKPPTSDATIEKECQRYRDDEALYLAEVAKWREHYAKIKEDE
ncbi:hypothetical protein [Cytobacillus sp. FSL R7-0680]|uniref:hypothetical protein n=1 Tax=Cytobacillus sp. FSL R7-0680 TaxID=2921689 RepID=UPI0030FB5890